MKGLRRSLYLCRVQGPGCRLTAGPGLCLLCSVSLTLGPFVERTSPHPVGLGIKLEMKLLSKAFKQIPSSAYPHEHDAQLISKI